MAALGTHGPWIHSLRPDPYDRKKHTLTLYAIGDGGLRQKIRTTLMYAAEELVANQRREQPDKTQGKTDAEVLSLPNAIEVLNKDLRLKGDARRYTGYELESGRW